MIKKSQPFGKNCQKTAGGIFLTHTVYMWCKVAVSVRRKLCCASSQTVHENYFSWSVEVRDTRPSL